MREHGGHGSFAGRASVQRLSITEQLRQRYVCGEDQVFVASFLSEHEPAPGHQISDDVSNVIAGSTNFDMKNGFKDLRLKPIENLRLSPAHFARERPLDEIGCDFKIWLPNGRDHDDAIAHLSRKTLQSLEGRKHGIRKINGRRLGLDRRYKWQDSIRVHLCKLTNRPVADTPDWPC